MPWITAESIQRKRPAAMRRLSTACMACVACTLIFLSGFVSCENKGAVIVIPKLDVATSIPVARSRFP
ncbi:MAG: hypothetical protein ACMG6H_08960, partial [Acidobacteriota bacterium]